MLLLKTVAFPSIILSTYLISTQAIAAFGITVAWLYQVKVFKQVARKASTKYINCLTIYFIGFAAIITPTVLSYDFLLYELSLPNPESHYNAYPEARWLWYLIFNAFFTNIIVAIIMYRARYSTPKWTGMFALTSFWIACVFLFSRKVNAVAFIIMGFLLIYHIRNIWLVSKGKFSISFKYYFSVLSLQLYTPLLLFFLTLPFSGMYIGMHPNSGLISPTIILLSQLLSPLLLYPLIDKLYINLDAAPIDSSADTQQARYLKYLSDDEDYFGPPADIEDRK